MRTENRLATPSLLLLALTLAGCASSGASSRPAPAAPVALSGDQSARQFNTGRILLFVTDWGGKPLSQARVDVESVGDNEYFRTAALSDVMGRVSFAGVPKEVRISVHHAATQGNYSRQFNVPATGTTELRMMLETSP